MPPLANGASPHHHHHHHHQPHHRHPCSRLRLHLVLCCSDIKPQNLLVDARSHVLKLCDFGSAKALTPGEPSVAYICSRYYRAPELIFGCTDYTTAIDVWSAGCVFGELILGHPLFPGETGVDQLIEIIKVLGTPTKEQVESMNPGYHEFTFPSVTRYPWSKLFKGRLSDDGIDLINKMLSYEPTKRLTALQCCAHPFFDELRDPATRLPDGGPLPPLFNYTDEELKGVSHEMRAILIPPFARNASNWPGFAASLAATGAAGTSAAAGSGGVAASATPRSSASSAAAAAAAAPVGGAAASPRYTSSTGSAGGDSRADIASPTRAGGSGAAAAVGGGGGGGGPASATKHYTTTASVASATPRSSVASAAPTTR